MLCFNKLKKTHKQGFRLICMSLLPIKGQKTLIYGSRDAGRTVVASDERFNEAMRIAAKTLNVSSCLRGIKAPGTLMHSAIDIEGAVFLVHFGNS